MYLGTIQILRNQDFDLFNPTHPVCNQRLLIKYRTLCCNIIIWPTPPTQPLDYVIFERLLTWPTLFRTLNFFCFDAKTYYLLCPSWQLHKCLCPSVLVCLLGNSQRACSLCLLQLSVKRASEV